MTPFRPFAFVSLALLFAEAVSAQGQHTTRPSASDTLKVAGVSVKGLTEPQMQQRLRRELAPRLNVPVVLTDGVKRVSRTRRDLGITLDLAEMTAQAAKTKKNVPLRLKSDPLALGKVLRKLAPKFNIPAQNARIAAKGNSFMLTKGQSSRSVDVGASASRLASLISADPETKVLSLILLKHAPSLTAETLQAKTKGITGRLSQFVTAFNPASEKRTHNIKVAVKALDGKIIPPGQVFSMNESLGERTHEHGYLTAPVIVDGKKRPGIGGGVSQVTGTLFNAALLGGLRILEYGTHAHPVAYLPVGRDATVAWQHIDLRFKNNTSAPIYLSYIVAGNRLTASLFGAKGAGQSVTLKVDAKRLGPRSIKAVLYRTIKKNGKVVKKEKVGRSDYNWKADYEE